ncbi:MAG: hypothetical protein ACYS8W_18540, partial [Planctomycetota bacterium]
SANAELAGIKQADNETARRLVELEDKAADLGTKHENAKREIELLESDLGKKKEEIADLQDKCEGLRETLETERETFRKEKRDLYGKLEQSLKDYDGMKQRYERARGIADQLRDDLKSADGQLEDLKRKSAKLDANLAEEKKGREELAEKYGALSDKLKALEKENEELRKRIEELEKKGEGEPKDKEY